MNTPGFTMTDFQPAQHKLLGEGVWGRVYDLDDGTVLKIARRECAGIGDGGQKIEREYEALNAFTAAGVLPGLVPQALGMGEIPASSSLAQDGFSLWLRMSRIEGQQRGLSTIAALPPADRDVIGANIGRALAQLHGAMAKLPESGSSDGRDPYREIKQAVPENGFYTSCIAMLEHEHACIPPEIRCRPAHNDFNMSNLLFAGETVCGILDFAEWGVNFPEKDISDIVNECPALEKSMVSGYEEVSGFTVSRRRLALGVAENALYGTVISERKGDEKGMASEKALLQRTLATLEQPAAPMSPPVRS